jgi:hypothetical protein
MEFNIAESCSIVRLIPSCQTQPPARRTRLKLIRTSNPLRTRKNLETRKLKRSSRKNLLRRSHHLRSHHQKNHRQNGLRRRNPPAKRLQPRRPERPRREGLGTNTAKRCYYLGTFLELVNVRHASSKLALFCSGVNKPRSSARIIQTNPHQSETISPLT